uniref:MAM domain-containing protein n=1 Tax=Sinocyclocheilus anshuiensis TaxID=1608454 RepID=A0A671SL43_9TELE
MSFQTCMLLFLFYYILFYYILFYVMELKRRNFEESLCIFHITPVHSDSLHFITVKEQVQEDQGKGKAVLLGPNVEQRDWSCFRMIYQVTGSASLQVQKHTDGESFDEVIDLQNSTETFKIVIEGKLGEEEGSSVSIFEIKISDKYCIECDFEEDHLRGYTNERNRYMNWRVGRSDDTALNDGTGQYMYVDSKSLQEVARLASPMTTVPMSGCLSFQYQQYHAGDHLFTLFSRDQTRNQSLEFQSAVLVSGMFATSKLIPNTQFLCDQLKICVFTEPTFDPSVANCDFESGYCQYVQTQIDSPLWRRVSVRPNIYTAGDHMTGAGTAGCNFGPPMPGNQKYCLKFFYSLRGLSGTDQVLSAYLYYNDGSKQEQIWTQNYKIRNVWIAVELAIQSQKNAQVVFISTSINVWSCSSVGLDDIKVTLGDSSSVSVLSHCDFETGLCGFTQVKEGDSGDWMLARGPTPTSYTGPRGDHTTGVGYYLHIEASVILAGHKARLLSSSLRGSRETQCLQFYYHMYGSGIGQLSVYLQTGQENQDKLLWTSHGEQGISWLRASVNYQCDQQHQIVFEATRGASVRSDIAIDYIVFERGPCRGILNNLMITYICYSRNHKHLYEIEYLCPLFKHIDVDFLNILLSCDWIV